MILIITAQGKTLEDRFNTKFGRTPWFIRFDSETGEWEAFENTATGQAHGARRGSRPIPDRSRRADSHQRPFWSQCLPALSAAGSDAGPTDDTKSVQEVIDLWRAGKLEVVH